MIVSSSKDVQIDCKHCGSTELKAQMSPEALAIFLFCAKCGEPSFGVPIKKNMVTTILKYQLNELE